MEDTPGNKPQLFIPTAFTPNNDGLNDNFVIKASPDLTYYHIRIFDNSNIQLYESTVYGDAGWDGNANGQAEPVGSYLWVIDFQAAGTAKFSQNGYVQLIR